MANALEPLDTRLHLQVILDPQTVRYMEAVVTWHKDVPQELRGTERRGFGVRFLSPAEVMAATLKQPAAAPPDAGPLRVRYETQAQLEKAYMSELRMGGVYLHSPKALVRDAKVSLALELAFAAKTFDVEATVLHVGDANISGSRGVALSFKEPERVTAELSQFLSKS